jgi:uroporphyrinogen decarboxylase
MAGAIVYKDRNLIKAIRFEYPDHIPMTFHINDACWSHYPQEQLLDLMESHSFLFPDFERPALPYTPDYLPNARMGAPYTDSFGCVWTTADDGIVGVVTKHPLASWDAWADYDMPNPERTDGMEAVGWAAEEARVKDARASGAVTTGGLRHGHTFLQLCDLRGYENLIFDMAEDEPRLDELIERLEAFNLAIVKRYAAMGCDIITYAEDLGMQSGPMLRPDDFRKYIKPSYKRLMHPARDAGALIHMHSDGDVRLLYGDLIENGVDALNLQDLVNGIDFIKENLKGWVCIELDIDRQKITPFGTPGEVDALILDEVRALGSKAGGLTMIYGLYPGVPLENVKALMDAMEKYAFYFAG